jgi:hypothetical protein
MVHVNTFFQKIVRLRDNMETCIRVRQATHDNIMLRRKDPLCMPQN